MQREAEVVKVRCAVAVAVAVAGARRAVARWPDSNWQRGCMVVTAARGEVVMLPLPRRWGGRCECGAGAPNLSMLQIVRALVSVN